MEELGFKQALKDKQDLRQSFWINYFRPKLVLLQNMESETLEFVQGQYSLPQEGGGQQTLVWPAQCGWCVCVCVWISTDLI